MQVTIFTANCIGQAANCSYPNKVTVVTPEQLRETGCLTSRLEAMDMKPNFIKKIKDSGLRYLPEAA